jgi:hypothetical protein
MYTYLSAILRMVFKDSDCSEGSFFGHDMAVTSMLLVLLLPWGSDRVAALLCNLT